MLEAQARGHTLHHYEVRHMSLREGVKGQGERREERLYALARRVTVQRAPSARPESRVLHADGPLFAHGPYPLSDGLFAVSRCKVPRGGDGTRTSMIEWHKDTWDDRCN
jgi:hypothetical protein